MKDVISGGSRGFGYVDMNDDSAAEKAIKEPDNSGQRGLPISVQMADPKVVHMDGYIAGNHGKRP